MKNAYDANQYFKRLIVEPSDNMTAKTQGYINDAHLVADPHGLLHSFEPTAQTQPWKLLAIRMFGKGYAPRVVLGRLRSWGYRTPRGVQTIRNWKQTVEDTTGYKFRCISKVATGSALYTGRPEVAASQIHDIMRANIYLDMMDEGEYERHNAQKHEIELWECFNTMIERIQIAIKRKWI